MKNKVCQSLAAGKNVREKSTQARKEIYCILVDQGSNIYSNRISWLPTINWLLNIVVKGISVRSWSDLLPTKV